MCEIRAGSKAQCGCMIPARERVSVAGMQYQLARRSRNLGTTPQ